MIIVEKQETGTERAYHLPDHQRQSWHDFFNWLIHQGHIETWYEEQP